MYGISTNIACVTGFMITGWIGLILPRYGIEDSQLTEEQKAMVINDNYWRIVLGYNLII